MSGRTEISLYFISAISIVAAATDLRWGRVFNWLTLPAIVLGVVFSTFTGGIAGAADSLLGVGIGLLLFGWMFLLHAMGGGDVKLLMALGAWGGARFAEETAVLSVLLGGVMAVVLLVLTGRIMGFARRLFYFLLTLTVRGLEPEPPKIDRKFMMPFGLPIAVSAVWVARAHPLVKWGLPLWP